MGSGGRPFNGIVRHHMINADVVKLACEYLDNCAASEKQATLVGMHWYVDGRHKTLPLVAEINEALRQRPQMRVSRERKNVVFSAEGPDQSVTADDVKLADKQYRAEFAAELKKLTK